MKVKVLDIQFCQSLCDSLDYSLPGFLVHEILQARVLEWVTIPFSRGSSLPRYQAQNSCLVGRFFTVWVTRGIYIYYTFVCVCVCVCIIFPGSSDGKESACNAEDWGSVPGLGRSPGGGNGNVLKYVCLENPMDRGAWWAMVHRVTKSWTWLSD